MKRYSAVKGQFYIVDEVKTQQKDLSMLLSILYPEDTHSPHYIVLLSEIW